MPIVLCERAEKVVLGTWETDIVKYGYSNNLETGIVKYGYSNNLCAIIVQH